MAMSKEVVLNYTIHDYSSHSGSYHPHHISVNKPTQQASRWSSGLHDHEQYVTVKFDRPVVARSITFGKFHKGHVCNLKEFKVYGGMDPQDDMIEILHSGLKNDTEPESFPLKNQQKNMIFPMKYIKIVPLSAFGANFNYSIWYVEVRGINEESVIQRVCSEFENFKEMETTRLCLKYFRQKNMMDVFHILKTKTGVELEHPLLSDLHNHLVIDANFGAAEQVLNQAHKREIYKPYSESSPYTPFWKKIETDDSPSARGGHQMCINVQDRLIYVFGGWDGKRDLADFWCFDIEEGKWHLISLDTQLQGGPTPRSCHKVCFDPASKSIFVLGRYVESPAGQSLESDFYRYYVEFDQWIKINNHTALEGGPELIFDHQMCVDSEGETLYVFGGRTVNGDTNIQNYSGLYAYNIKLNHWKLVRNDDMKTTEPKSLVPLKSRVGHSMLFDQSNRLLYVFAGQRVKDYLSDLYRYEVDQDVVTEIAQDYSKDAGPDAGFTQRATIDEELQELYVLSGYMRNPGSDIVRNALWVYSIKNNEWQKVYQNESREFRHAPCPRFAHQMVYDPSTKTQYIFGGNPGDNLDPSKRLDDFWELQLTKPDPSSILRRSFYMIRMQKLRELCSHACDQYLEDDVSAATLEALDYLRTQVAPVVNHENELESSEFHQMCANLCFLETMVDDDETKESFKNEILKSQDALYAERTRLFENLLEYIPQDMKEPLGKLTNAVKLIS
ncbi:Muskelin N-terminus-domain-containing protein [Thamnidium elegans]|nr:Muskelin N-terminus-domain-containing protein [Thamnidium elegans]